MLGLLDLHLISKEELSDMLASRPDVCNCFKTFWGNTSIISESLGHSSEKVTQIYLDSFQKIVSLMKQ